MNGKQYEELLTMISVVTLDKVKLTGMYGGVQFQF